MHIYSTHDDARGDVIDYGERNPTATRLETAIQDFSGFIPSVEVRHYSPWLFEHCRYIILQLSYRLIKGKNMQQAKLSSKFQLSIPKSIRDDMRLHAGQKFTVVARGSVIELIPVKTIKDSKGMLPLTQYDSSDYRDRQDRDQ